MSVIVRVSEAHVRDGLEEEFLTRLRDLVSSFAMMRVTAAVHSAIATACHAMTRTGGTPAATTS